MGAVFLIVVQEICFAFAFSVKYEPGLSVQDAAFFSKLSYDFFEQSRQIVHVFYGGFLKMLFLWIVNVWEGFAEMF